MDLIKTAEGISTYNKVIHNYAAHMLKGIKPKHDIFRVSDIVSVAFGIYDRDKVFEDILSVKDTLRG